MKGVRDMDNQLKINDEVEFWVDGDKYTGLINLIYPNGMIRINSLVGEYRRKINEVHLINRKQKRNIHR